MRALQRMDARLHGDFAGDGLAPIESLFKRSDLVGLKPRREWQRGLAVIPLPWRGGVVAFGFGFWVWQPRHQPPRLALPSPLIRQRGIKVNTAVIALFCAFRLG